MKYFDRVNSTLLGQDQNINIPQTFTKYTSLIYTYMYIFIWYIYLYIYMMDIYLQGFNKTCLYIWIAYSRDDAECDDGDGEGDGHVDVQPHHRVNVLQLTAPT